MNSTNILFIGALVAFCCINFSHSIRCFTCDNKATCKKPKSEICNSLLANKTRAYLDFHHKGVNTNATSLKFECFRENIKSSSNEYFYKGCSYTTLSGCTLPLKDFHTNGQHSVSCYQCSNRDGCNPAERTAINFLSILAATIVGGIVARHMVS